MVFEVESILLSKYLNNKIKVTSVLAGDDFDELLYRNIYYKNLLKT